MNKHKTFPILFTLALIFLASCNAKQTADDYLKEDTQRKAIVQSITQNQAYMTEMMDEMMNNDTSKQWMMDHMMSNPSMREMHMNGMMNMCNEDSTMCKMMIGKTMKMCADDSTKCKMMMGSMQMHPTIMKSMKGICDKDHMKK